MKMLIALMLLAGCPGKQDKQAPVATPSGAAAVVPNPLYDGGLYDSGDDALTAMPMAPPQDASPAPPPDGLTGDGGPL
jgi:hypothetical protein